jgi:aryl-alcohol dehydrogenase-like predicted oxidoreductase
VIATKCGLSWNTTKGTLFFVSDDKGKNDAGQYRIHKCLDPISSGPTSRQPPAGLRTDHVDLYLTHWQDVTVPIEDTMALLLDLQEAGKDPRDRRVQREGRGPGAVPVEGAARRRPGAVQHVRPRPREDPAALVPEEQRRGARLLSAPSRAADRKIPADREFKEGDLRRGHPSFTPENLRRTGAFLDRIKPIADRRGLTIGQLVIAWTVAQPGVTHALVGARTPQQAVENAKAGSVELTADELGETASALAAR